MCHKMKREQKMPKKTWCAMNVKSKMGSSKYDIRIVQSHIVKKLGYYGGNLARILRNSMINLSIQGSKT